MANKIGVTKNGIKENCTIEGNCTRHYRHIDPKTGKGVIPRQLTAVEVIEMVIEDNMEIFVDGNGREVRVHPAGTCAGQNCSIHNPSNHPLKEAPLNWRDDRKMMERICTHGVGHPDPDDVAYNVGVLGADEETYSTHGCDGCCATAHASTEPATLTEAIFATKEADLLPWTGTTLKEARSKLSGLHFAKESLTDGEREILYIAEALLRRVDEINDEVKAKASHKEFISPEN